MSIQNFSTERVNTPTGAMLIVTDTEHRLRALDWEDHAPRMHRLLQRHYGDAIQLLETTRPSEARRAVEAYFEGNLNAVIALPTATNGTDFQRMVWRALREIPAGQTLSYSALAAKSRPPSGGACGRPCERLKPHRHRRSLPSRHWRERRADRLWRRAGPQALAAHA